jgi:hypothetical protein
MEENRDSIFEPSTFYQAKAMLAQRFRLTKSFIKNNLCLIVFQSNKRDITFV